MMNIVVLVKDRPKLTKQALDTLVKNTDAPFNLTIVDDASKVETRTLLRAFAREHSDKVALLRNETSRGIVGQARNLGVYWAEKFWGRGEWLVLVDNDIAFLPNWASRMATCADFRPIWLLGGSRHPYHQVNVSLRRTDLVGDHVQITDAVAGYLHFMRWNVWDCYGPFDAHAPGVCQSEDFAFCRKIIEAGGKVGYINPPVILHCGLTNTEGKPAIGSEAIQKVEGYWYE